MADSLRARLGPGVAAILAYGSCLRGVAATDSLIDLYVLTPSLKAMPASASARWACRIIPPNVYFAECPFEGATLRCKYAMLPLDLFARWMAPATSNPYFWARFAQPSALVYAASSGVKSDVIRAVAQAIRTAYGNARGIADGGDALNTWQRLFENTYRTELRSERADRARDILLADRDYYQEAAGFAMNAPAVSANWPMRRIAGRAWSVARLVKAAFTFSGGADYLAWKIERHSGDKLALTEWQRRHPILASITLLPRLLRKGAVR
ncbi:MAG: hypothetical protein JNM20_01185 [Rhizobiales bacterium]|nr:hypothetical protein [Hyphomicrobiales bacterium]